MNAIDIVLSGFVNELTEQINHDAQRIVGLELEVESLRRDLKTLESFQQELTKMLAEKLGLALPNLKTMKSDYQKKQLTDDLSPLERLNVTGFRLPPPE